MNGFKFVNIYFLQSLHSSPTVAISLDEVVDHFSKTAPPKRKLALGINDGPDKKKTKKKEDSETEDSESDSSSSGENMGGVEVEVCYCVESMEGCLATDREFHSMEII